MGGNLFADIQQMAPLVIGEEMSERHLLGTDRDPVPTCKAFVNIVVSLLALYHLY